MKTKLKLITMSEIQAEEVKWLWYPYIPFGKITIIQGDPGEGKTTFVLALTALLTRGLPMPDGSMLLPPTNIIYQTAEDGLADTIKPRLDSLGADCSHVLVIDENERELTLDDHRLAQAIQETNAGLVVLDPIQAYLGDGVDMHRANEVRPVFKRLCKMAERTGCAVILIGHMNKMQGVKSAYRGLGSIDFRAAARSVLLVGRSKDDSNMRVVVHDKSSLAPEGQSIFGVCGPVHKKLPIGVRRYGVPGRGNAHRFGGASIASGYTPRRTRRGKAPAPPAPEGEKGAICRRRKQRSSRRG